MNMNNIKNKWPMHVFFISQGISLFGVGYATLPLLILLFWLIYSVRKSKNIIIRDLTKNNTIQWIVFYYFLFVVAVIVSDIVMNGNFTDLDGPLYKMAFGVYMLLGYLIARSFSSEEIQSTAHYWVVFWLLVLLVFIKIYYNGIYRYHHGIFASPHILFSGLIMISLINMAHIIENINIKNNIYLFSCILILLSFILSYRYSTSDVLAHLYLTCAFIMLILSTKKISMYLVSFLVFALIIFFAFNPNVFAQFKSVDVTHPNWWMELLNQREYVWSAAIRMIGQHPIWGVGSGNFRTVCGAILEEMNNTTPYMTFAHAHNLLLQNFAVHGVIAGTTFVVFLLAIFRSIFNSPANTTNATFRLATLALWAIYVIYGSVDNAPLYEEIIPLFWGTVGLFLGSAAKEGVRE